MTAKPGLRAILVFTALLSGAGIACAQSQNPSKAAAASAQSFRAVDKNRDGKVDGTERKAALEDWRQRWRDEQKRRSQGAAEARKAAMAEKYARQKVSPKILEQYDRNRNGEMDPQEWECFRQDLAKQRGQ